MNKKGGLETEELVKLIIGVVIIVLVLLPLSVKLIGVLRPNSVSSLQAESLLEELNTKANSLQEGERDEMLLVSPKDWAIIDYEDELCVCPLFDKYETDLEKVQRDLCSSRGRCEEKELQYVISGSDTACVKTLRGEKRAIANCISLEFLPRNLVLINQSGEIILQVTYIEEPDDLTKISGRYVLGGEEYFQDFSLTYRQVGDRKLNILNFYPLFKVKEAAKKAEPSIFIDRKNDNYLELKVFYNDGHGTIETTEGTWWVPSDQKIEIGYVSLTDGSVYITDSLVRTFFDHDKTKVGKVGEDTYKGAYKINILLDVETLKEINKNLD